MGSEPTAADVVAACIERGLTIATGESLTAGLLAASLADVPGCSAVLRGSVVAYQPDVKQALLGVTDADLARGVVSEQVAAAMADGVRRALSADIGVGTTGVAGPEPHDGEPVGSVWIAVATSREVRTQHLVIDGDRAAIRRQTVVSCLALLMTELAGAATG
ncbi:MAG: CinA family protein [Actinobacteria bacterium]|nr:CinA family protein [Actinomycetota bacterium]